MKVAKSIRLDADYQKVFWDKLVNHPIQSWAWGQFRQKTGVEVARLGIYQKNILIDGWQITFHKLPLLPWTVGYFPKGPAVSKFMVDKLTKLGQQQKAIFIQIEPNIVNNHLTIELSPNLVTSHRPLFTKYTFILDLTKSEEELLKSMHPKTRYNIRLAQKHQVEVQEDNSEKAFQAYLELAAETTARQKFYAHDETYHRLMWQTLKQEGLAHLFTASYQKQILAAWIIWQWKDTLYYPYGSSSRNNRQIMAPNLLLWEIVKWGKAHGFKYFDLWGSLGPNPSQEDPWYGFHRFKEGYHPKLVEFSGSHDLVINPWLYRLYTLVDKFRWWLLRIKKQFFTYYHSNILLR